MVNNKIYIQISAGRGPAECCWVVAQVLKVLIRDVESNVLKYEIIQRQEGREKRTLNSVLLSVSGQDVKSKIKAWEGTIQWIGQSPFRKFHKRKNWFVGVSFFEKSEELKLDMNELEYQTFRSSGPGGQHRNKVETAVRVIHKSSGLQVTATDSKSQVQNKKNALQKMVLAFENHALDAWQQQMEDQWSAHLQLERGNPVKVFKGPKFS